jgi:vitamin B12 transporter
MTADVERREDALQNTSTRPSANTSRYQNAVALGYGIKAGDHAVQANARHDDDSEFGGKTSGALAYGYAISPSWRATASTGTAFRVPTLYQRFSIYGSSSLMAETSNNQELGVRWLAGSSRISLVGYHNEVSNLINYVGGAGSCGQAGCYVNTGRARMTGFTLAGATQMSHVNLGGSVDWMDPRNLDTDKWLARRARQQATVTADFPFDGWRLGAETQYVGERFDNASNSIRLAPYNLIHLNASRQLGHDWRLLARVNNLTAKDYVLASGYATPGRSIYLGLSWAPQR